MDGLGIVKMKCMFYIYFLQKLQFLLGDSVTSSIEPVIRLSSFFIYFHFMMCSLFKIMINYLVTIRQRFGGLVE